MKSQTKTQFMSAGLFALTRLTLICCCSSFLLSGQTLPPGFQLNPISSGTGVATFAASANTNQLALQQYAQLANLSHWLKSHIRGGQVQSGVSLPHQSTTYYQAPISGSANIASTTNNGLEIRLRTDGSLLRIQNRATSSSPAQRKQALGASRQTAREFLSKHRHLLRSDNPDEELTPKLEQVDDLGRRHVRFEQRYRGLRVWPCELVVHSTPDGDVDLVENSTIPTPQGLDTNATLTAEQAIRRARDSIFGGAEVTAGETEIIVYGPLRKSPRLAWKFEMNSNLVDAKRCVIDAHSGEVLSAVSLVCDVAVTGSGVDALGVARPLNLWQKSSTYYMVDTSKSMYDVTSLPPTPATTRGAIIIYDCVNTPATSNPQSLGNPVYSASSSATAGWVPDAVSASYHLSEVYDYYSLRHARNSLDGNGGAIVACVRLGVNLQNAFWLQQLKLMAFGDGYSRSLDVCGHELTHGVINSIGDGGVLEYQDQPGALNEAFADIFGEMIEARTKGTNDWLMGSQLGTIVRSMSNPLAYGQPATMSQYLVTSSDQGGVHANSGIINHAYFLLAVGLDGAIGRLDAERIFYRALTLHLQKQSEFVDARLACVSSAEELYGIGSSQAKKTEEAFDAVEIFDAPPSSPPSSIPAVQAPDSTLCLRLDWANNKYYLVRHETARGDSTTGTAMNTISYLSAARVSVSGDGSLAVFVTVDHDLGIIQTDNNDVTLLGKPNTVHSVAISPNGRFVAITLLDSYGYTTDQIQVIDLLTDTHQTFSLYAVNSEGEELAIVDHADVMDFTADGQYLIYDALCSATTADGFTFDGWAIFRLDIDSGEIQTVTDPNSDYNVGNPALGNTKNHLLTFEIFDNFSGNSTVCAGDLFAGKLSAIGTVNGLGVPGYTGDDSAIVYSRYDSSVDTEFSLVRQPVASDGITKSGTASSWFKDADFGVIYRRGAFTSSNAFPSVNISYPIASQAFTNPASITIQASAADAGGSISRVEFYTGSTKLGQDTTMPYSCSWQKPPVGSHRLVARAVDNLGGVTDSTEVEIFVKPSPDVTRPLVSIISPANGQRLSNSVFAVMGKASDNVAVSSVWGQLNGEEWTLATGITNWTAITSLIPGTNTFRAYAVDGSGNCSTTNNVSFVYVQTASLTVQIVGNGTVTPNYDGQWLELGKGYSVTAKAGTGSVFSNWASGAGIVLSNSPALKFVMQSNLVLRANFIPNPYVPVAGNYAGLFYDTNNGVTVSNAGYVTASVTTAGKITAKLQQGAMAYSLSGQLSLSGDWGTNVVKNAPGMSVGLRLNLATGNEITGCLSNSAWSAAIVAHRAVYSKTNLAPQAGQYTLVIPASDDSADLPGGSGAAAVNVSSLGAVKIGGILGDGSAFTESTFVSGEGQWPLYASLYSKKGILIGWLTFTNNSTSLSDMEGVIGWIKPGLTGTKIYPAGFDWPYDSGVNNAFGSVFTNRIPLMEWTNGLVILEGGNLPQSLTNGIVIGSTGKGTSTNKSSVTITTSKAAAGLFKGSVINPATGKSIPVNGAVFQRQDAGFGSFLGTNQSGSVLLQNLAP